MPGQIHPSQKRRAIDRHHVWTPGHHPRDDDATPTSPWTYVKLDITEDPTSAEPDQRALLTDSVDTGVTCWGCGEDTFRLVGERSAQWILEQPGVEILGAPTDWREQVAGKSAVIWACPHCQTKVVWKKDQMPEIRR